VIRNEKLTPEQREPVGYFTFYQGRWVLVNQKSSGMKDITEDKEIPLGEMVELTDGKKILLSREEGGRIIVVTLANK